MEKLFLAAIKEETVGLDYFKHIGVGKINATYNSLKLINLYKPKMVINYLDKKSLPNDFWIIHIRDITETEFKKPNNFLNYTIKEKKYFNRLELYQLKKNGT